MFIQMEDNDIVPYEAVTAVISEPFETRKKSHFTNTKRIDILD